MGRVLINPLLATSMQNQCELVKRLLEQNGVEAEYKTTFSTRDLRDPEVQGFLVATLATVWFLQGQTYVYLENRDHYRKPFVYYVTVEGVPVRATLEHTQVPQLEFIGVSHFVRDCLRRAGLKVVDVVHHAVDADAAARARERGVKVREKKFGHLSGRCLFLYVGRNDPRKRLEALAEAVNILNRRRKGDYALLLHTDVEAVGLFQGDNVFFEGGFGSVDHGELLSTMAAVDYGVFPSACEGFGLPVLEQNAVGRPVLHCWMPPLDEFSSKEFNFVWDYDEIRLVSQQNVQYWVFHLYDPNYLAEMMELAIDTWKNDRAQYEEYCAKAVEHAAQWDYRKVYPRLLHHLGVKVA